MGLVGLVKSAGERVWGGEAETEPTARSRAHPYLPEEINALIERRAAAKLASLVESLGSRVGELAIKVQDDMATVAGETSSQGEREKIVLTFGNTSGIVRVDDTLEIANAEPEAGFSTVQSGDTLSKIAK